MNFTFATLLALFVLIPGFVSSYFYRRTEKTVIDPNPFATEFIVATFFSAFLHLIWLNLVGRFGYIVHLETLLTLLISPDRFDLELLKSQIAEMALPILSYFITISLFAWLFGWFLQFLVIYLRLDQNFSPLKFDADWVYFFKRSLKKKDQPDFTEVSLLVETPENSFIYLGILNDFFLKKDGSLDRVVLNLASRRKLENDLNEKELKALKEGTLEKDKYYYDIRAEKIIIKYEEIKNISVTYWDKTKK